MRGFNEAVTDALKDNALETITQELYDQLGITQEELEAEVNNFYITEVNTLVTITEKIADAQGVDSRLVWKKIVEGYIQGNLMHLRDIDRTFGRGSLFLLSLVGQDPDPAHKFKNAVYDYFAADTKQQRLSAVATAFPLYEFEIESAQDRERPDDLKHYQKKRDENIKLRLQFLEAQNKHEE